jgi:hypothetical protein
MMLKGQFRSIFGILTVYPSLPPRHMIQLTTDCTAYGEMILKGQSRNIFDLWTVHHSFPQRHMIPTDHRLYSLCEMMLKGQFCSIFGLLTVYPSLPPRRMIPTNHRLYSLCEMMLKGESRSIFGFLTVHHTLPPRHMIPTVKDMSVRLVCSQIHELLLFVRSRTNGQGNRERFLKNRPGFRIPPASLGIFHFETATRSKRKWQISVSGHKKKTGNGTR